MLTRPDPTSLNGTFEATTADRVIEWLSHHASTSGLDVSRDPVDEIEETYLDTDDRWLHRAGYSLALRRRGQVTDAILAPRRDPDGDEVAGDATGSGSGRSAPVATRASISSVVGIHQAEPAPDVLLNGSDRVAERVRTIVGRRSLTPVMRIGRTRQRVRLDHDGEPQATLILDEIQVARLPGGTTETSVRVQLRVDPEVGPRTHSLLQVMRSTCQLRPAPPITYEAACGLVPTPLPPAMPDLGETGVEERHAVGEAAVAVIRSQLQTWLHHEAGTRLGEDIEELHDMRVAIRRMRAAIRLFRPFVPSAVIDLRDDLRWLGRILGEVRDLDVQIEQIVAWKGTLPAADAASLEALHAHLEDRRREARRRMLDGLDAGRYDELVTRLAATLREPVLPTMAREVPALVVAPSLLTRAHRRVLRDGRRIRPGSDPQRYHDLRIRCKQLRYALEFHTPLYGTDTRQVIRRLVRLQNLLGKHQDADVAVHWLREEVLGERSSVPRATAFVVGRLVERYTVEAAQLRDGFPEAFALLSGKRWKRLQSAMASGYEKGLTRAFKAGPRLELS